MSDSERRRRWLETVRCGEAVDELVVVKRGNLKSESQETRTFDFLKHTFLKTTYNKRMVYFDVSHQRTFQSRNTLNKISIYYYFTDEFDCFMPLLYFSNLAHARLISVSL